MHEMEIEQGKGKTKKAEEQLLSEFSQTEHRLPSMADEDYNQIPEERENLAEKMVTGRRSQNLDVNLLLDSIQPKRALMIKKP